MNLSGLRSPWWPIGLLGQDSGTLQNDVHEVGVKAKGGCDSVLYLGELCGGFLNHGWDVVQGVPTRGEHVRVDDDLGRTFPNTGCKSVTDGRHAKGHVGGANDEARLPMANKLRHLLEQSVGLAMPGAVVEKQRFGQRSCVLCYGFTGP